MLERYLLVWLILSSSIAFVWPVLARPLPGLIDPFMATTSAVFSGLIAITMLAIGMMLPRDEVHQVIRRWPMVLGGTAVQFTAMPLLAYTIATALGLQGDAFIGLIMVGCVPGAMASNVLTMNARGNVSYSVSLTTAATLLSPLVVPLLLAMALAADTSNSLTLKESLSMKDVSLKLLLTVVGPVVAGHLLSRFYPSWGACAKKFGPVIANLAILWIIAAVVGKNREQITVVPVLLLLALILVNVCGYTAGFLGGRAMRLPVPMRRALTLEVGMQNAGLGTMLAVTFFPGTSVALAPAIYTFGCMLTGTLLANVWARISRSPDETS